MTIETNYLIGVVGAIIIALITFGITRFTKDIDRHKEDFENYKIAQNQSQKQEAVERAKQDTENKMRLDAQAERTAKAEEKAEKFEEKVYKKLDEIFREVNNINKKRTE